MYEIVCNKNVCMYVLCGSERQQLSTHFCGSERQQAEQHAGEDSNAIPFLEAVLFFSGPDLSLFARAPVARSHAALRWLHLRATFGQAAAVPQSPWPRLHACNPGPSSMLTTCGWPHGMWALPMASSSSSSKSSTGTKLLLTTTKTTTVLTATTKTTTKTTTMLMTTTKTTTVFTTTTKTTCTTPGEWRSRQLQQRVNDLLKKVDVLLLQEVSTWDKQLEEEPAQLAQQQQQQQ